VTTNTIQREREFPTYLTFSILLRLYSIEYIIVEEIEYTNYKFEYINRVIGGALAFARATLLVFY
jgi:hypothetical protein